jgi:hypothetical protein
MCCQKLFPNFINMTMIFLFLVGCSTPAAIPAPTTEVPSTPTSAPSTEIPPTQTAVPPTEGPPTPTPLVLITSIETLIGNWEPLKKGKDSMFLQVNLDGTCHQSFMLETLNDFPQVDSTCAF